MSSEDVRPCTFPSESPRDTDGTACSKGASHLSECQNASEMEEEEEEAAPEPLYHLTVQLHGKPASIPIYADDATIQDLSDHIAHHLGIPPAHQKLLITPKVGLLTPPFQHPELSISSITDKKIVVLGATTAEVRELASDMAEREERTRRRRAALQAGGKVTAQRSRDWQKLHDEARFTFHAIQPLAHLPHAERSRRFLQRLADDAGIKAAMRHHRFSVGLLTEIDPADHTTPASRTLGLNRNRGEVIELRLRTDAADGYRDYRVIRHTLCHELTHNVWADHDPRFWSLCRQIEAEVERNDWRRAGHALADPHGFAPAEPPAERPPRHRGAYVLGPAADAPPPAADPPTRSHMAARAADARRKKQPQPDAHDAEDAAARR